ncbi:transmembrane protein 26-like [Diadema antillarum]|uniref:transmembrane protein 26-like n=1 Tax=Diadema antillarum TaxID=105358 RepID=UPI003A86105B
MAISRFFMIIQGLTVRCLFCIAAMISVFGVVTVKHQQAYWLLLNLSFLLFLEAAITFTRTKTGEWKWFCPSVLLFLVATVPSLWLLEMSLLSDRLEYRQHNGGNCISPEEAGLNETQLVGEIISGLKVNLFLSAQSWSVALQQALLFVLILGRWLLPKGDLTRDQLSQLLLVYIGIAADILEFVTEGLKLEQVRCNRIMVICILSLWTWSLLQFTLGLTATKARKPRVAGTSQRKKKKDDAPKVTYCCETEVWGIMATVIMQDGPFLTMRLYLLTVEDAVNHMMIFFTCKNMLIMLLQVYRLLVICIERPETQSSSIVRTVVRYRDRSRRYVTEHANERRRQRQLHHDLKLRNRDHKSSPKHSVSQHRLIPDIDPLTPGQAMPLLPAFPLTLITGQERGTGDGGDDKMNDQEQDVERQRPAADIVDQREELSDYDNATSEFNGQFAESQAERPTTNVSVHDESHPKSF